MKDNTGRAGGMDFGRESPGGRREPRKEKGGAATKGSI